MLFSGSTDVNRVWIQVCRTKLHSVANANIIGGKEACPPPRCSDAALAVFTCRTFFIPAGIDKITQVRAKGDAVT